MKLKIFTCWIKPGYTPICCVDNCFVLPYYLSCDLLDICGYRDQKFNSIMKPCDEVLININDSVQECSISSASSLEIQQPGTKPLIWNLGNYQPVS